MTTTRPIVLACVLSLAAACSDSTPTPGSDPNLRKVIRANLPITIKEQAELQAIRETVVRSEVEGQATIIYLAPEGKLIEKGEKLVALDCSDLEDKCNSQKITVGDADASLVQAKKALDILQKDLCAKRNTAESTLRIAEMELEKFLGRDTPVGQAKQDRNAEMVRRLRELVTPDSATGAAAAKGDAVAQQTADLVAKVDPAKYAGLVDKVQELLRFKKTGDENAPPIDAIDREMGDMANKVLQQVDKIRLAMADLKYQETYYEFSRKLADKQFYTHTELEKDAIELQRRLSTVGLAWNDLDLLISYELPKNHIKLQQDVDNARLDLERVIASNDAEVTRSKSDLDSKQLKYDLVKGRLDLLVRQIRNAVITAPTPGMVIYARVDRNNSRNSESIREGTVVRERQDLIILPDATRMQAVVKVQEAVVAQVRPGQIAHVEVEAEPNRVFTGKVARVAQQADSNTGWMSSDRKVYTTVVELDDDNSEGVLRSRMAAAVTILVEELKDVLVVPLQAVRRDRSVNYVWRSTEKGPEPVPVKTGKHNAEFLAIEGGLAEGDVIFLTPPIGAGLPTFPQPAGPTATQTSEPVASANGNRAENAHGPNAGENGGDGRQGKGPPGDDPAAAARMNAMRKISEDVKAWLLQKYPDRKDDVEDRRARMQMLADSAVQDALKAENPGLWERYDQMLKSMRGPGGQGGPKGGKGGDPARGG